MLLLSIEVKVGNEEKETRLEWDIFGWGWQGYVRYVYVYMCVPRENS